MKENNLSQNQIQNQSAESEKDYKSIIEALLFASGRLMNADILLGLTGASSKQVLINNVSKLRTEYDERGSPLMIVEEKDGWKLTVREKYLPLVRKIVSETELPRTILETLAVIAWKAPVLQSEIIDIRHNKAYDHIGELEELEFIRKEPKGRSQIIKLTEKFYTYFDVEGAKDIREVFTKVVGSSGQSKVADYVESAAAAIGSVPEGIATNQPVQEEEIKTFPESKPEENKEEFNEL